LLIGIHRIQTFNIRKQKHNITSNTHAPKTHLPAFIYKACKIAAVLVLLFVCH
jgi:hypothetical protein